MKYKFKLFILALIPLLVASCTREPLPIPLEVEAKVVTIKVDIDPETRVAYDGGTGNNVLSWQENDQLMMIGFNDNNQYQGYSTFTRRPDGLFQGNTVPNATKYKAFYPVNSVTMNQQGHPALNTSGNPSMPAQTGTFWLQTQDGNNNTAHINNKLVLWDTDANPLSQNFVLTARNSIIKFVLSNIPTDVGQLTQLVWVLETASNTFKFLRLNISNVTISSGNTGLTAFLSIDPSSMNVIANGKVRIVLYGAKPYFWLGTSAEGKTYQARERYTGTVTGGWQPTINPLSYVAQYNVNPAGNDFVNDLTACDGSGFFTHTAANNITIAGYHLPSRKEWAGIVPEIANSGVTAKVLFPSNSGIYNNYSENVQVQGETFNTNNSYDNNGDNVSYGLRYMGPAIMHYRSAWKYEYFPDATGARTYMKITCRNVSPALSLSNISNAAFWSSNNQYDVIRYFPASGYKDSNGTLYSKGNSSYFCSSDRDLYNDSYTMTFTNSRAYTMYFNNDSNLISARLFTNP